MPLDLLPAIDVTDTARFGGGPLDLDPRVAGAFIAHIEMVAAAGNDSRFEELRTKRDFLVAQLDEKQRGNALLIANAMTRLAQT